MHNDTSSALLQIRRKVGVVILLLNTIPRSNLITMPADQGDVYHPDTNVASGKEGCRKHQSPPDQPSKRHKKEKHRHDHRYDSSSDSSSASYRRRRHPKKSHRSDKKKSHKKKKDKKHKTRKKHRRESSRSPSDSPPASSVTSTPPGAHELAYALTKLFDSYPAMASLEDGGIPLLFIQLSRGTEFNLSQMPDRNLARLLEVVFESLIIHGMELGEKGGWKWGNAPTGGTGRQGEDDTALLRLARALLNGVGFTTNRVQAYEQGQQRQLQHPNNRGTEVEKPLMNNETQNVMKRDEKSQENEVEIRSRKRVERMTSQMLDRFDPKDSSSSATSLANELQGICTALMEGESIQLDGIENEKLKATLTQLFLLIGLEVAEMDDDDEVDDEGNIGKDSTKEKALGYAIPDSSDVATVNLNEVLRVCRFRSSGGSEGAPTSWAAKPIPTHYNEAREESSSDDDDGPAPLGTIAAVKASKRQRLPQVQNLNKKSAVIDEGGREEWMLVPGEHDFLKGISKSTRSRTFKNEKMRGQAIVSYSDRNSAVQINPEVLEEVNAIQKAYEQSRGPSLFDAHRQKSQESKQQRQANEWTWSRDSNLDDGRRVDKKALHLVLGGASTELKSKFQGSLGRS